MGQALSWLGLSVLPWRSCKNHSAIPAIFLFKSLFHPCQLSFCTNLWYQGHTDDSVFLVTGAAPPWGADSSPWPQCGWMVTEPAQRNTCQGTGTSLFRSVRQWISCLIPGNKFVNSAGAAINPGHCSHLLLSILQSLELWKGRAVTKCCWYSSQSGHGY